MKNAVKRLFPFMMALCLIISSVPVTAAEGDIPIELPGTDNGESVGVEPAEESISTELPGTDNGESVGMNTTGGDAADIPSGDVTAAAEGGVPIDEAHFPSEGFRNIIIEYDLNGDGFLSQDELNAVKKLSFRHKNCGNIIGIEYFTELTYLECTFSYLTSLDVSKLTKLKTLICNNNQLTRIDLSHNKSLGYLECQKNLLEELNLSANPEVYYINCYNNKLTVLDLRHNPKLEYLYCQENPRLTKIDLSNNPNLKDLYCTENPLLTSIIFADDTVREGLSKFMHDCYYPDGTPTIITKEPTCGEPGIKEKTCAFCKKTTQEEIPPTGKHEFENGSCKVCGSTILPINENNFPDDNFRNYILDNIDTNKDSVLTIEEINSVDKIELSYSEIDDIIGIEHFTNLQEFRCIHLNGMTTLDLSGLTSLKTVTFDHANLTTLNLSGCTSLESVYCRYNENLTALNLSGCTSLKNVNCHRNQLKTLNLSGCTALVDLQCGNNQLETLDLSELTSLNLLYCHENKLTTLDVSKCTEITTLICSGNQFTTLNVSTCTAIKYLFCTNNRLTTLDLTAQTGLQELKCKGNEGLEKIDFYNNTPPGVFEHDCVLEIFPALAPTCTETGLTEGNQCKLCKKETKQEVIPALGHTPEDVAALEPTCGVPGHEAGKQCSVCGEWLEGAILEATGNHSIENGRCTVCNAVDLNDREYLVFDPQFCDYIKTYSGIDKNHDYYLTPDEYEAVKELNIGESASAQQIRNLRGIEVFTNLETLDFSWHKNLQKVDVSKNDKLTTIIGDHSEGYNLKLILGPGVKEVQCSYSGLYELDCMKADSLETVNIWNNDYLHNVDLSNCPNLKRVDCSSCGNLYTVYLSNCPNLELVNCRSCSNLREVKLPEGFEITEDNFLHDCNREENRDTYVAPTCISEGKTAEVYCSLCGIVYEVSEPIPKLTHDQVTGVCEGCNMLPVNANNFPDEALRAYIINLFNLADSTDPLLTDEQLKEPRVVIIDNTQISSLEGLSYLNVTKMIVINNEKLTTLSVPDTVKTLTVGSNTALTDIRLGSGVEMVLISNNPALESLSVYENNNLKEISCSGNASLSRFEAGRNPVLEKVICSNNNLTTLGLRWDLPALNYVDCSGNSGLTEISLADGVLKELLDNNSLIHDCNSVELPAIAPTCTEPGREAGTGCSFCGIGPAVIPATGEHSYENGFCTSCGQPIPTYTVTLKTDGHCTIEAVIKDNELTRLRGEDDLSGTIVYDGDKVPEGTVLEVTATAKEGYVLETYPSESPYTVNGDLTLSATAKPVSYKLTVNHENGVAPLVEGCTDLNTVPHGTRVKLTAGAANEGFVFIGWYQTNGKQLTADEVYEVTVNGKMTVEARYQKQSGVVTFMANNQIAGTFTGTVITESDFPATPSAYYGFAFTGWDKNVSEINTELSGGNNVTVTAIFEAIKQKNTVTIYNGGAETPEIVTLEESTPYTVKADAVDGMNFVYWTMDGKILTYNRTASIRVVSNCTLEAVYSESAAEALGTALLKTAVYNANTKKLAIVAYLTVPENSKITSAGLVAASSASEKYDEKAELTKDNADYVKASSVAVGKCAPVSYTWTKSGVSIGDIWYARAYITYTDASGTEHTVYGDRVTITAGQDYDSSERATAQITSKSYDSSTKKAKFVAYTTVPEGAVISKAGLVAAGSKFDAANQVLTAENAEYVKISSLAVGKSAPVSYTWTKSKVNSGDAWYVRAYLVYTLNGVEHTVYGKLVTLTAGE